MESLIGKALKKTGYDGAVVLEPFYKFGGEQGHNMRMWRDLDKDLSMENRLRIAAQGSEYIKTQFEGRDKMLSERVMWKKKRG